MADTADAVDSGSKARLRRCSPNRRAVTKRYVSQANREMRGGAVHLFIRDTFRLYTRSVSADWIQPPCCLAQRAREFIEKCGHTARSAVAGAKSR
jgi:hypothetical protein